MRAPHGEGRDELAVSVLLSPGYHSSLASDEYLAACKTLAKRLRPPEHRLLLSRAIWLSVIRHNLAFDLHQHGTSKTAPTMLLSLIIINALAASALTPARNRLPVQRRQQSISTTTPSMRYGRKQLKIRQRVKSDLQRVVTIDDLAEVISSPEFYLANRRMSGRLMTKIQKKAASLGYQQCGNRISGAPCRHCVCAMALSSHAIDAELPA